MITFIQNTFFYLFNFVYRFQLKTKIVVLQKTYFEPKSMDLANSHLVANPQNSGSRRGCKKLVRMVRLVIENVRNDVSDVCAHSVCHHTRLHDISGHIFCFWNRDPESLSYPTHRVVTPSPSWSTRASDLHTHTTATHAPPPSRVFFYSTIHSLPPP